VWLGGAESFHTLALDGVPVFGSHIRSSAYRFVTLVDVRSSLCLVIVNTCQCELGN
jgi:predicted ATPase